jgi:hypothetical protein
MTRSPSPAAGDRHGIIRLVPKRSRAKAWVLLVLILLLAVVGSVSYLGWRQTVPGVQVLSTPPRFLGQKTPLALVLEARRGNVAQVEVRVVQSGTPTSVAKQEGPLGRVFPGTLRVVDQPRQSRADTIEDPRNRRLDQRPQMRGDAECIRSSRGTHELGAELRGYLLVQLVRLPRG